jgi:hypothetical protein
MKAGLRWTRVAAAMLGLLLLSGTLPFALVAQDTSTTTTPTKPLTPAQSRAQARAQAAAERRAQAHEKAQERAQARAQGKAQAKPQTPAKASPAMASPAKQPAATGNAAPATAAPATAANRGSQPAQADKGTLTQGNVVFSPTSCVHNGTKAVCTFTFTNQGNAGNLVGANTLGGAQFVDDAHVPHRSDARYYLDKYGTRQGRLYANAGDTGTFVAEFPNVDARVSTGEFHMRDQTIGGISVTAPESAPKQTGTPAAAATPAAGKAHK